MIFDLGVLSGFLLVAGFFDPNLVDPDFGGDLTSRGFTISLLSCKVRPLDWDNAANAQFSSKNSTIAYVP